MTSAGEVVVNVSGRDVNLVALLNRLDAQMRQTDQAGLKLSQTTGGTLTAAQQRAANSAIIEAQAMARAAIAVGDDARAHQILVTALGQSAGATDRSVAGLTASIGRLQSGAGIAQQFGEGLKGSLLGIVGPAALAGVAIGTLRTVVQETEEAFKLKATLDATTRAIGAQLVGLRASSAVFAEGRAFADRYKLTQQELTAALQTSISVMRVSDASTTDILNTFARLVTLAPDKTISDAARAVRELASGDVTSIKELFNVSAANAHKMKEEIAAGGDAIAVISGFLDNANIEMQGLEASTTGASGKMKELAQETERLQLALAGQSGGAGLALLEQRITLTRGATRLLSADLDAMGQSITNFFTTDAVERFQTVGNLMGSLAGETDLFGQTVSQAASEAATLAEQAARVGGAMDAERQATVAATDAAANHAALEAQRRGEMLAGADAAGAEARMLEQSANASLLDTQAKQLETLQTQLLNQEAQATAAAFLAANPQINASGIQAAVTAGAITPLIGRLAELALQLRDARAALASFGGGGGPGLSAASFATSQTFFNKNAREAAAAAAAAQREQTLAVGTTAAKMALLNRELAEAKRRYGEGSAQAIRAQTAIDQAIDRSTKKSKGAGAAKLSDQAKLNNSLLANQERYQDQAEAAERAHVRRVLDIEREFLAKSLAQQRENEVSKRQSRADFYDSLTSATKDVGPKVAHELSAAYEAAYAQAQAIAQAGNAKLAADYLALKEQQIKDEIEFQKRLAEAKKAKDPDEIRRLEAIHKLRQDAQAEEEKQLLAGGDTNVAARDAALADEQRTFEEQQGKIGTAAENAADRKVNAAQRAGKAVEDENVRLREQETIINRIGARGGGAPGTASAPPVTPGAATGTPIVGGAAPLDLSALAERLQAIVDAIHTEGGNITKAQSETTRAVQQSAGRAVGA